MKILLCSNLYVPFIRGGAERMVEVQAEILAQAGHDVLVLSTTPDGSLSETVLPSGVRVHRFRPRNVYYVMQDAFQPFWKRVLWHLCDAYGWFPYRLLRRVMAKEQPDVIITHNLKGFGLRAVSAIRMSRVKHVHFLHDLQLVVPSGLKMFGREHHWQAEGVLQRAYVRIMRRRFGSPDVVVSPSQYLLDEHLQAGLFPNSETRVLQNGIKADMLGERDVSDGFSFAMFVGMMDEHKGVRVLLEAWSKEMEARLLMVGSGALEEALKMETKERENVEIVGRKSPSYIGAHLAKAEMLIVPSLCYENSPTVIMEALSMGTPIVASDIGGIPELLQEGDGVLVKPGDVDALREAVKKMLSVSSDRKAIQKRAERFAPEIYASAFLKLVEEVRGKK